MKNILFFGASYVQGVGGANGGWADKLKLQVHQKLYGQQGMGEICQVYPLGIPGASARDLLGRLEPEIRARVKENWPPEDVFILLVVGTNDSRAKNDPAQYVTSTEEYEAVVRQIIEVSRRYSAHIAVLGTAPVDESKTNPKYNPITGGKSYFTNERLRLFDGLTEKVCREEGVEFIDLQGKIPADWAENYLYAPDGLHPNDRGHQWIAEQVRPFLDEALQ